MKIDKIREKVKREQLECMVIEVARVDTWQETDEAIRDLSVEEKEVWELFRKVCDQGKWEKAANLT